MLVLYLLYCIVLCLYILHVSQRYDKAEENLQMALHLAALQSEEDPSDVKAKVSNSLLQSLHNL